MGCAPSRPLSNNAALHAQAKLQAAPWYPALGELRGALSDPSAILEPSDGSYSAARTRPYNQDFQGYPLLVVQPRTVADVQAAVNFVRAHGGGVTFCITCGGHSNRCMLTDSFVLDLQRMNGVMVDKEAQTATVEGGAYLADLDSACAPHGLATTAGTYPQTGVGGLVLAGGYGWLARKHGLSVDNLLEVEVVLPNGRVVIANDSNEYSDLIWGCRGGGGNFGIVTKFVFRLHPIPRQIMGGLKVFLAPTLKSASQIAANYDSSILQVPDVFDNDCSGAMLFPAGAPVVVTVWAYTGTKHSRVQDVPAFRAADRLGGWLKVENSVRKMFYHSDLQKITQMVVHSGLVYTSLIQIGSIDRPLPPAAFEALLRHTKARIPPELTGDSFVLLFPMGGKYASIDGTKTCLDASLRNLRYFCIMEAAWKPGTGDKGRDAARAWVRKCAEILRPYRTAVLRYAPDAISDHRDVTEGVEALTDVAAHDVGFTSSTFDRLGLIKGKYDPHNLFRQNFNVQPVVKGVVQ